MTPDQLVEHRDSIAARYVGLIELVDQVDTASADSVSQDHRSDAFAEALFLRAFTAYENDVERLFLHYVTGGVSLQGVQANTYLRTQDEALARKLTKGGFRFLNWAKPQDIKVTAENYIENGWPIVDMMAAKTQDLSDCERVRNRIAHNSLEAAQQFNTVQRNLLATERLFAITPGQLLRIRSQRLRKLHITHYIDVLNDTIGAILDPPP